MKNIKPTFSDYLAIALFIIGLAFTFYQVEIKLFINHIMEKWRIILFIISVSGIFFVVLKVWLRSKIEDKYKSLKDEIIILANTETKLIKEVSELKTDLELKEIIYKYRSEFFYKAMTNYYSLTNEPVPTSVAHNLAKAVVKYKEYDGQKDVYAPLSLPTEHLKEKTYFRDYLKANNIRPNETEILVKKYCIDCFE